MAAPDMQKHINHMFQTMGSGIDEAALEVMITDNARLMLEPARQLLAQAGLLLSSASADGEAVTAGFVVAPRAEPFALLDHACGIGPVAAALLEAPDAAGVVPRSRLLCADFSAALVDALRRRIAARGWEGIETAVLDAQETDLPAASFTHITLNFAMHVLPGPERVLADAHRLLRPGGALGFTVWAADNAGLAADLRYALAGLPFAAPPLPDPLPAVVPGREGWATKAGVAAALARFNEDDGPDDNPTPPPMTARTTTMTGRRHLVDLEVRTCTNTVRVDGPEHYLRLYGPMVQWATKSFWDEATRARAAEGGLLERHVLQRLRDRYGGGGWDQEWTYIVATCKKPL